MATLDALAPDGVPVELKSAAFIDLAEPPPIHWQVQVQHQCLVMGASRGYLCALDLLAWEHRVWRLDRDEEFISTKLIPAGREFWACVTERREPPIPDAAAAIDAWRRLHGTDDGREIQASDAVLAAVQEWEQAKAEEKRAKEHSDGIKAQLEIAMGDASCAHLPDGSRLTYRTQERAGYVVQPASFRVLRVSRPKSKKEKA
jgi:predicted phage-related endonuclease